MNKTVLFAGYMLLAFVRAFHFHLFGTFGINLASVQTAFGTFKGGPNWNSLYDVNNDSKVDIRDLALICKSSGIPSDSLSMVGDMVDANWMLLAGVGFASVIGGALMSPSHYHFWPEYYNYRPSTYSSSTHSEPIEEDDEDEDEPKREVLMVSECPKCEGPLQFGDKTYVICPHCGAEVRRVNA